MASAKRQAQSYLGNENDYINLKGLNEERQLANDVYNTNTKSFQNAYNDLLNTIASNRTKAKTDFGSGRSTVSENAYLQNRNNIADNSARGLGNGVTQLNKLGNRMETGRQFSDLANTYYNTLNELNANEKTYTNEYNTNMESAKNTLNAALADVSAREKAGRNAYKAAVAQLAEQIQARRDANANAARAYALQKAAQDKKIEDETTKAIFDRLKAIIGKGNKADNYISARDEYKNLVKNATDKDAIDFMTKYSLYDSKSSYDKFKRDIFGSSKVAPAKSTVKKKNTGKTYSSLFGNSNGMNRSYEPIPTLGRR